MRFYLGTAYPNYFEKTDVPLCISAVYLEKRRTLPRARNGWLLDSGAFSQISTAGKFSMSAKTYAHLAQRCADEMGYLDGAAIQDWMCEPFVLARTGKNIIEHQKLSCESYAELRYWAPDISWIPVLQGYHREDYLEHLDLYSTYGDDLRDMHRVGVGSICRRQATGMVEELLGELKQRGLRLHGFGLKQLALRNIAWALESADSMAWSQQARRQNLQLPGHLHKNCNGCLLWALQWRDRLITRMGAAPKYVQGGLMLNA